MERKELIEQWYTAYFPKVAAFISKRGGSFEDAKDIFQESLLVLYEQKNKAKPANEAAYLFGVCKNRWYKMVNERAKSQDDVFDIAEQTEPSVDENRLIKLLNASGKKCMQLLQRFYYDNLKTEKIRDEFGYSSNHSTTVQKYKCLEKIRETVKQNSLKYESFFE